MAKTVTIPLCSDPFEVVINGVKYLYKAGETVSVPDDVAAIINAHNEGHHKNKAPTVNQPFDGSWNALTDKPFGEGEPIVVVPETTVTVTSEGVIIGEYTDLIKDGATCIVSFNDTDYECIAYEMGDAILIGNNSMMGIEGGNNEPFLIGINDEFGILMYCSEEGEATISIKVKPIEQLDEKYLPDSINNIPFRKVISFEDLARRFPVFQSCVNYEANTPLEETIYAANFNLEIFKEINTVLNKTKVIVDGGIIYQESPPIYIRIHVTTFSVDAGGSELWVNKNYFQFDIDGETGIVVYSFSNEYKISMTATS